MQDKVGASYEDILAMRAAVALIERNEGRRAFKRLAWACAIISLGLVLSCAAGYWTVQNLRAEHAAQVEAILARKFAI